MKLIEGMNNTGGINNQLLKITQMTDCNNMGMNVLKYVVRSQSAMIKKIIRIKKNLEGREKGK